MISTYHSPARQRGAATILAAIFLVVSISLMAVIALNMAGSDINDTAMQSDAVEALFIAETGIEHASYLYANGTACLSLSGGSDNVGRGAFSITDAQLVGGHCRVRVEGTVTQTHAVKRTIDADLQLNGGGVFAVGNGGAILEWNGSGWNSMVSNTGQNLTGIHCTSANDCRAVGDNGTHLHWDGTAWSSTGGGGSIDFTAVACTDNNPDDCYAPGETIFIIWPIAAIQRWSGGPNWSNLYFAANISYLDIACSTSRCYLVADNGRVIYRNGGAWGNDGSGINNQLNGISCTSDDICWAVGNRINGPNAYAIYGRSAGGNWFSSSVAANPSRNLHDLDCYAPDQCWAVGAKNGNSYTVLRRNGAGWGLATPALGSAQDLNGISCISSGECWAVGDNGRTLYWDGATWTAFTYSPATRLNDVFFLGNGGSGSSGVSLVRWQEVIL